MLFNSLHFLFFFPVVVGIYFFLAPRYQNVWLLAASCYFYMAFVPSYILILAAIILIDFFAARFIWGAVGHRRRMFLLASIAANIGVLAVFKYYDFFAANLNALSLGGTALPALGMLLPIGLSFHTFQAMSYTIEVYRGTQVPEKNFLTYALYVMFFPQLVAGPIERPQNLLGQFNAERNVDYPGIVSGLRLMAWGLLKKVVIADHAASYADVVFNHPGDYTGISIAVAVVMFAVQIYGDFSGYSDIAIGAARCMGFRLMENFRRPYRARSVGEFWNRWHISLSSWFRDYVYIPLGGSRVNRARYYSNIVAVFLLSGLWHGASWTFVIWGALNAFYILSSHATHDFRKRIATAIGLVRLPRLYATLQMMVTFSLTCLAWIWFRAASLGDAARLTAGLFRGWGDTLRYLADNDLAKRFIYLGQWRRDTAVLAAGILLVAIVEWASERIDIARWWQDRAPVLRWGVYVAAVWVIANFGVHQARQFIYFVF